MNFRLNQKKVVHQSLGAIRKDVIQKRVGYCCEKLMNSHLENGLRNLICLACGRFERIQESVEIKANTIEDLDKRLVPYGSRSGAFYKAKMKDEVRLFLVKTMEAYPLTELQLIKIMDHYFAIRDHRIPRANPRKGLILACVYKVASIPIEYLSKLYELKQHYITEGLKAYRRDLLPFEDFSLFEMVDVVLNRFMLMEYTVPLKYRETVHEIVKLSVDYYVSMDTTVKTKVAGALYFLVETGFAADIEQKKIGTTLEIGTTTIYKFYDQLVVAIFEDYNENIKYRRDQLVAYLEHKNIRVTTDFLRKRMDKYMN
jgi:hypothetical protein